jgi:hypothetical protein
VSKTTEEVKKEKKRPVGRYDQSKQRVKRKKIVGTAEQEGCCVDGDGVLPEAMERP